MVNSKEKAMNKPQSKILVVEDSTIVTKAVSNLLIDINCQVDLASEGQSAIKLANDKHYDLIFMDIELPDIDGCEIAKMIRANEKGNKPVPIVALTASADEATKINCINMGMNTVVSKPLSIEQAEQILNALIPHRNVAVLIDKDALSISAKREEYASLPLFDFESAQKQLLMEN